jgi:predicted  nucleic acid-binding Zn-ribbon protein
MISKCVSLFAVVVLMSSIALRADDQQATTESRLREALRNTTLHLRDAQNQVVALQAAKDQADKDNADLKAKLDALNTQIATLTKQSADDKAASDKTIADLNSQVADQTGQIARLNQALTEWKNAYNQVSQLAAAKGAARDQLALQATLLQRTVDDRETKNLELYKIGNEILTRYEKFGLGDAIGAKEPFVSLSRVKLETLVQSYKDKLLNQTVAPGQLSDPSVPASSSSAHSTATSGQEPSGKPPTKA